jgi:hypothetical protein
VDDDEDFDRLCRRVFAGVRDGAPDHSDSCDLAATVLELKPADRDAVELASLSVEGAAANWPRMAELAGALLATACFELGLSEEPGWLKRLDDAMCLVNRDAAASGLPHGCRLSFMDFDPAHRGHLFAESWDGTFGTSTGIPSSAGADPVSALLAVAEDAQDAVMHTIWSAWPQCPAHQLGAHPRDHDDAAVWWCAGDGGHVAAAIGAWRAG